MPRPKYHSYFTTKNPPYPPASQSCHSPFHTPCRALLHSVEEGPFLCTVGAVTRKLHQDFHFALGPVVNMISWTSLALSADSAHAQFLPTGSFLYLPPSPRLKERHSAPCPITAPKLHGTHVLNSIPPFFYHFLWISPLGAISHSFKACSGCKEPSI